MTQKEMIREHLKETKEITLDSAFKFLRGSWFNKNKIEKSTVRNLLSLLTMEGSAKRVAKGTYVYKPRVNAMTHFAMNREGIVTLTEIKEAVCRIFDITLDDLGGKSRQRICTDARKAYCFLAFKYIPSATTTRVGRSINKDHSTMVYSRKEANQMIELIPEFRKQVYDCEALIEKRGFVREGEKVVSLDSKEIGYYFDKPEELAKHYDLKR